MSNNKKAALIQHWNELGQDRPWRELAQMFDIKSTDGSISGELARCIVKNYRKKLKEQVEIEEVELQVEPKLKLKSRWSIGNKWGESYVAIKEGEVNPDELKKKFIEEISKYSPKEFVKTPKTVSNNVILEVSLPDLHFGKNDINVLKKNFLNSIDELVKKASGLKIEKFLLPIGNDGMNHEGLRETTTKGTPQLDTVDWRVSFKTYYESVIEGINLLLKIAPVDVVVIQGNHDYERMWYLADVVKAWFRNNKDVTVDNSGEDLKFYEYGKVMLLFNHGDKIKAHDLPLVMATEQPEMFARTKHREVHLGHIHKEKVDEFRGIKVRFLPSICEQDTWHASMGYKSYRCAQAYAWNKETGLDAYFQVNL
jgi:hypothetical protein